MPATHPHPQPQMHNAHIIRTGECALRTIEHIESVPYAMGLRYDAIAELHQSNTKRLQRCKSAILADNTFIRLSQKHTR